MIGVANPNCCVCFVCSEWLGGYETDKVRHEYATYVHTLLDMLLSRYYIILLMLHKDRVGQLWVLYVNLHTFLQCVYVCQHYVSVQVFLDETCPCILLMIYDTYKHSKEIGNKYMVVLDIH